MFSGNAPKAEEQPPEKELTLESVRAVLAEKSRAGYSSEVHGLIEKYGGTKLSNVDPSNYAALLASKGKGEFCAGEHCRFCKVKANCSKRAEYNLELAKYDFATADDDDFLA